jgi:hypothetical protein
MTDPEEPLTVDRDDLVEREADVVDQFERELPIEADEADVIEQKLDVPDSDEDAYPG